LRTDAEPIMDRSICEVCLGNRICPTCGGAGFVAAVSDATACANVTPTLCPLCSGGGVWVFYG
jgi:DnaJ-class molecular chaperone